MQQYITLTLGKDTAGYIVEILDEYADDMEREYNDNYLSKDEEDYKRQAWRAEDVCEAFNRAYQAAVEANKKAAQDGSPDSGKVVKTQS